MRTFAAPLVSAAIARRPVQRRFYHRLAASSIGETIYPIREAADAAQRSEATAHADAECFEAHAEPGNRVAARVGGVGITVTQSDRDPAGSVLRRRRRPKAKPNGVRPLAAKLSR